MQTGKAVQADHSSELEGVIEDLIPWMGAMIAIGRAYSYPIDRAPGTFFLEEVLIARVKSCRILGTKGHNLSPLNHQIRLELDSDLELEEGRVSHLILNQGGFSAIVCYRDPIGKPGDAPNPREMQIRRLS